MVRYMVKPVVVVEEQWRRLAGTTSPLTEYEETWLVTSFESVDVSRCHFMVQLLITLHVSHNFP